MKKKFHILVFGCQMNYADSARIKAVLTHCGFEYVESIDEADIVIFDTCSVRQKSEDKITGKLTQIPSNKKIWITGCMIQHGMRNNKLSTKKLPENLRLGNFLERKSDIHSYQVLGFSTEEIKNRKEKEKNIIPINHAFNPMFDTLSQSFSNIELFLRIDDIGFFPLILPQLWYEIESTEHIWNEYEKIIPENINTSMNKHTHTAYVPISTWCNQFCSYCIVPYARGLERHFEVKNIIEEVKSHLENWVKEIVLLGQIVNKHPHFVEIIKEILKLEKLEWLRYTSPYPTYYSDELLALHEKEEKLCPHIHIPLQSGSSSVLKKMFRWYNAEQAYEFIDKIKKLDREISITTDFIVGFTDESEDDFQQTLDMVNYANFDMIYIGIYSPRPWTYAYKKMLDNISREEKHSRWSKMNTFLNKSSKENNQKEVGKIRKVIVNDSIGISQDGTYKYSWYTDNMKQISFSSPEQLELGTFVNVKITKGVVFKLIWEVV